MSELENMDDEMFAQMYAAGKSVRQISIKLGLHIRAAYRRCARKDIKERVKEIAGKALEDVGIDSFLVIQELTDVALGHSKDKVKALELLGKHLGLFTDRLKVEGGDNPIKHTHIVTDSIKEKLDEIYK